LTSVLLVVAIAFEVIATSALKATEGFTPARTFHRNADRLRAGVLFPLADAEDHAGRHRLRGVVGAGVVLIAAIGWIWYRQPIDVPGVIGIALILAGVLVVNLFSRSVGH